MAKVDQIAQSYIAKAAANPGQRHEICREAAYTFVGLARNPKNAHAAGQLAEVGKAFAFAAASERPPVMDDFANLLQETAAAYEKVGPFGDDQMDLIAARREINQERSPRIPGQVFITPESFNMDATLGRTTKIKWQPTDFEIQQGIQQAQTVAFWQGTKKEAQSMTIDSSLGFQPNLRTNKGDSFGAAFASINNRAYVHVEFGSDGNRNIVEYDLRLGQRCTAVGNYLSVLIGAEQPGFGFDPQILEVGASIGAFAAPSAAPLVRTLYIDNLIAGDWTDFLPIPLKAAVLLPVQASITAGGQLDIILCDAGGNTITGFLYQQGPLVPQQSIPLYGDVAYVAVKNLSLGTVNARLSFQLSL